MKEAIQKFLVTHLDFLPPELLVIIVSAMPILELRGGLPLAFGFGFPFWKAVLLSLFGNALPIIPVLLLFQPLSKWLLRFKWYRSFYTWLHKKAIKNGQNVSRYGAIGLALFTAVPLPTTGAYSACFAASFFGIRFWYALVSIIVGVVIAGLGVGVVLYSVF